MRLATINRAARLCAVLVLLSACGDDSTEPASRPTGNISVQTITGGHDIDTDGYIVALDDSISKSIGANSRVDFTEIQAGSHQMGLLDIASNCTAFNNPQTLTVSSGETTASEFDVQCVYDVGGSWSGQYSTTNCTLTSGSDPFFCDGLFYLGRSLSLDLSLQQSFTDLSGTGRQGQLDGVVAGTLADVAITLSGQFGVSDDATTTIQEWLTVLSGDSLIGSWVFDVVDNAGSGFGSARVTANVLLVGPSVPRFENCPVERTLSEATAIGGVLEPGDCQFSDESYYDVYAVDVLDGVNYEFAVSSSDFRPFLFVVDLQEQIIAAEGNASDSVASFLLNSVADETLLIIANSLYSLEEGSYSVTSTTFGAASVAGMTFERVPIEMRVHWADLVGTSTGNDSLALARRLVRASGVVATAKRGALQ